MRLIFIFLFLSVGCSFNNGSIENGRRNLNEFVELSETHSYFLSDIPKWAHVVESASCSKSSLRYINIEKLMNSFSFKYEMALQFQLLFNSEYDKIKKETGIKYLPIKNEEELFFSIINKVQAGFLPLKKPDFDTIHLVWIDPYKSSPKKIEKLLNGKEMEKAPPALVSLCLNQNEMIAFQDKINFSDAHLMNLSSDLFSVFHPNGHPASYFHLHIDHFLKNKNLVLFIPKGATLPAEFKGKFKIKYY
ncbi:MAG: hypothetical protein OEY33_01845 [Bdellovibrionales bacterium]|nr:hypothetical protein [Bdellovibrionales bacterium]